MVAQWGIYRFTGVSILFHRHDRDARCEGVVGCIAASAPSKTKLRSLVAYAEGSGLRLGSPGTGRPPCRLVDARSGAAPLSGQAGVRLAASAHLLGALGPTCVSATPAQLAAEGNDWITAGFRGLSALLARLQS